MNERTTEFDLAELIGGSVDSIEAKLSELSDSDLKTLHDMESKGKKRSTLMDAIHREQKTREPETPDPTAIDDRDAKVFSVNDVAKLTDEHGEALMQRLTDGMAELGYPAEGGPEDADAIDKVLMALRGVQADRDKLQGELHFAVEQLDAHARDLAAATADVAEPGDAPALSAMAVEIAGTGECSVVFLAVAGERIAGLPPLHFLPRDWKLGRTSAVLNKDVQFPATMPRTQVIGAVLRGDDADVCARADLVAPFEVGGGKQAKLPAGTLSFA